MILATLDTTRAEELLARGALGPETTAAVRGMIRRLEARRLELSGWAYPLMERYLPPARRPPWRLELALGLAEPLQAGPEPGTLLLDVAAPVWAGDANAAFEASIQALFRSGLRDALPKRPKEQPASPRDLALVVLASLQEEGLVAHYARQGQVRRALHKDYMVIDLARPMVDRFQQLDTFLADRPGPPSPRWGRDKLAELGELNRTQALVVKVGAYMAAAIEEQLGRDALVETIEGGPLAFYEAYQSTGPGAMMSFRLPPPPRREPRPGSRPLVGH